MGDWSESVALFAECIWLDVETSPWRRGFEGDGDGDDDLEASLSQSQLLLQPHDASKLTELLLRLCRGLPSSSSLSSDLFSRSDVDFRFFDT